MVAAAVSMIRRLARMDQEALLCLLRCPPMQQWRSPWGGGAGHDRDEGPCTIASPVAGDDSVHGGQTLVATIDEGLGRDRDGDEGRRQVLSCENSAISATSETEQNVHDGKALGWVQKKIRLQAVGGVKC